MALFILFIFSYLIPVNSPIYDEIKAGKSAGLIEVDLSYLPIDTRSIKILRKPRNEIEEHFIKRLKLSQNSLILNIQEDRGEALANIINKNFFWRINLSTKPYGRMNSWKGKLGGEFSRAGISFFLKNIQIIAGRDFLRWGIGESHFPILSGESPSFDMIYFHWKNKKYISFDYFISALEPMFKDSIYKRYISGHRIKFSVHKFSLYFTENILYGGRNRQIDPYYINPLMIYYVAQWNNNYNDNVFWDVELCYNLKALDKVYSGLFIDDFQYNSNDYEPPEIALLFGLTKGFGYRYINIEYARSNDWVYNQHLFWNKYVHYDKIIGDNNGPDFDMISLKYVSMIGRGHYGVKIYYRRRGDNSPLFKYPEGPKKITHYFLTGIVEKRLGIDITSYFQTGRFILNFSAEIFYAKNWSNTKDANRIEGRIKATFGVSI